MQCRTPLAALFSIGLLVTQTGPVFGADVLIPCKRSGMSTAQSLGLRDCPTVISEISNKLGGTVSVSVAGTGTVPQAGLIQQTINGYYAGLIQSPIVVGNEQVVKSQKMITPFCDLVAGKFNSNSKEVDKNHKGESCGSYAEVKVAGLGDVTIDLTNGRGSWEESHIRGGFIQAVNCSYQQVINEMNQKSGVTMSDTCAALGEDIQNLGTQANEVAAKIESELVGQQNVAQIESCAAGTSPVGQSAVQQSACLLQAGRSRLETAFTYFAACEIMSRARSSYRHHFVDDINSLTALLESKVAEPCEAKCKSTCKSAITKLKVCAEDCAKSCYRPLIQKTLEDKLNSIWPNSGACAGFLFAVRRRKRITPKKSRPSFAQRFTLLAVLILLSVGPACSNKVEFDAPCRAGDQSTITNPQCCQALSCGYLEVTYGVKTEDKSTCEDYGIPLPDMASVPACAVTPADETVVEESSLTNGGGSAGAAEAAIGAANGLISGGELSSYDPTSEVASDEALPNTSAAIAKTTTNPSNKAASNSGGLGGSSGSGGSKADSGGKASGSVGQAGGALNFGNGGTTPSAIGSAALGGTSLGGEAGGSYQASGGGGAGTGGVIYGGGAGGGIDGASTGNSVTELGATGASVVDGAGTPDPDDYFTRVGLEDDLFKIVEKRYRATSTAWIHADLARIPGKKGSP